MDVHGLENPMSNAPMSNTPTTATADQLSTNRSRSMDMYLINEALSRARTRRPHNEAYRSARRIAMQARRTQARELGDLSQLMLR